jgi:hypothetical protein
MYSGRRAKWKPQPKRKCSAATGGVVHVHGGRAVACVAVKLSFSLS